MKPSRSLPSPSSCSFPASLLLSSLPWFFPPPFPLPSLSLLSPFSLPIFLGLFWGHPLQSSGPFLDPWGAQRLLQSAGAASGAGALFSLHLVPNPGLYPATEPCVWIPAVAWSCTKQRRRQTSLSFGVNAKKWHCGVTWKLSCDLMEMFPQRPVPVTGGVRVLLSLLFNAFVWGPNLEVLEDCLEQGTELGLLPQFLGGASLTGCSVAFCFSHIWWWWRWW